MATGRARRRADRKRLKYLRQLAVDDPDAFARVWAARLDSWLLWIRRHAGRQDPQQGRLATVFGKVDEVMETLSACGAAAYQRHAAETRQMLLDQCVTAFGKEVWPQILRYKRRRYPARDT